MKTGERMELNEIKIELRELYQLKDNDYIHINDAADYAENLHKHSKSAIDALVKSTAYGQWIDIREETPEFETPVLVFDGDGIAVARLSDDGSWCIHESYGFNEDGQIPNVYFWMSLPSKPSV